MCVEVSVTDKLTVVRACVKQRSLGVTKDLLANGRLDNILTRLL